MIPVVIISLARAADRRSAITQNLDGLGIAHSLFEAIDGRAMSAQDLAAIAPRPYVGQSSRPLSAGEIGCAASFRAVLTRFLEGGEPFLCVAEDDASFAPDARHFLDPTVLGALPPFDVLRLVNDPRRGASLSRVVAWENGYAVHAPLRLGLYMIAQVFSRAGAQAVLAGLVPLTAPIDNLIYRDVGILGLRVLEVRPAVVTLRKLPSMIGERFQETAKAQPRGLLVILRRKHFLIDRRIRAITSYLRAWGARAILQVRAFPRSNANESRSSSMTSLDQSKPARTVRPVPLSRRPRGLERMLHRWRAQSWFSGKEFTTDWTSEHFAVWHRVLSPLRNEPLRILEIGSWEGRSAVFFLKFFARSTIACIDTFKGNSDEETYRTEPFKAKLPSIGQRFDRNLAEFTGRVEKITSDSRAALARLAALGRRFDLAYVDGNHRRDDVMADSLGVWQILAPGGMVIWDDYAFGLELPVEDRPQAAIDAFLGQHEGRYRMLAKGKQMIIERID